MSKSSTVAIPQSTTQAGPVKESKALHWPDHVLTVLAVLMLAMVLVQMMVPVLPVRP